MAQKKFSELETGTVDGTSIFAQTKTEDGSLVSKSASSPSLAGYIGTSHQFAGLSTTAKNLVGAINEAASMGGVVQLTQAEYTALSTAEKMNGSIYKLTDKAIFYCLDEEYHAVKELTTAQYEALTTAQQNNGTIYIQTDKETTGSDIAVSDSDPTSIAEVVGNLSDTKIAKKSLSAVFSNSNISSNIGNAKTLFDLDNDATIDYIGAFCNGQPLVAFTNSTGGLFCGAVLGSLNATYAFTAICFYH